MMGSYRQLACAIDLETSDLLPLPSLPRLPQDHHPTLLPSSRYHGELVLEGLGG
jgi:hypothetical protein